MGCGDQPFVAATGGDLSGVVAGVAGGFSVGRRIDVLLQGMAAFAPPSAAQTSLANAWQDTFSPVLVAANGQ